jgi:hypothetical protein
MWLLGFNLSDAGEFQKNLDISSAPMLVDRGEITRLSLSNLLLYMGRSDDQLMNQKTLSDLGLHLEFEQGFDVDFQKILGMIVVHLPKAPRGRLYREGERSTHRELRGSPVFLRYNVLPQELRTISAFQGIER